MSVARPSWNLKEHWEIIAATVVILLFNAWEHLPNMIPSHYTDITSVYWREGIGQGGHLIPYSQFVFEYPVLVGVFVYLCSFTQVFVADFSTAMVRYTLSMDLILSLFSIGTVILLCKICDLLGKDKRRIWSRFLITPTFLMFPLFNWDMIAVFFLLLSIYLFLLGRKTLSGVALGLGVAGKLIPILMLPVYVLEEKTWKQRLSISAACVITYASLNAPFMLLDFGKWFGTWTYHMAWGIEDSWLIHFFDQMDPNAHYVALAVILYLVYKGLIETSKKTYESQPTRILQRSFLMNVAWLFGSYVVTPQMALFLLPFYVLIPTIPLPLIYLADILNAMIIVLWFSEMEAGRSPLVSSSPVQIFATLRQLIWLAFFIYLLYPAQVRKWVGSLFQRIGEEK